MLNRSTTVSIATIPCYVSVLPPFTDTGNNGSNVRLLSVVIDRGSGGKIAHNS